MKRFAPSEHQEGTGSEVSSPDDERDPDPCTRFDRIYRAHALLVARWVARLGGPTIEVEDVVHEVFIVVSKRLSQFRGDAKITTWLFRITENIVRNWRRKQRWRRLFRGVDEAAVQDAPSMARTPDEELEGRQAARDVYAVLDLLSERHRSVIVMFELEEMSTDDIAEVMRVNVGTVRVWLHRARAEFLRVQQRMARRAEPGRGGRR